jgi:superfamily II DNA helicase RecQ
MKDQIDKLGKAGVDALQINSAIPAAEALRVVSASRTRVDARCLPPATDTW